MTTASSRPRSPLRHVARIALVVGWCALVWYLSSQSDPTETVGIDLGLPDWAYHGIEYLVGGLLTRNALAPLVGARRGGALAVVFCLGWGVLDEWHQSLVPGRTPDGMDVAADLVGAALGSTLHALARRGRD